MNLSGYAINVNSKSGDGPQLLKQANQFMNCYNI